MRMAMARAGSSVITASTPALHNAVYLHTHANASAHNTCERQRHKEGRPPCVQQRSTYSGNASRKARAPADIPFGEPGDPRGG